MYNFLPCFTSLDNLHFYFTFVAPIQPSYVGGGKATSQFVWWLDSVVFLIALAAHVHKQQKISKSGQKDGQILNVPLGKKEQETPVAGLNIRMH